MTMTATTHRLGTSLKHEVDVNGRHMIVTDEPLSLGGTDEGPAPHELLPAALASCIATMVAMYAEKRGWEVGDTSVDVSYDSEASPRRFEIQLNLPAELSSEQLRRLERVAEGCPLRRALEAGFTFQERLVTTESIAPAA
ncbi:MAG: OsmC family protein [Solirubrobacterales bacterium]